MKEIISRFENISIFERNCAETYYTWWSGKLILKLEILGQIWNLCKENFEDSQTFCSRSPPSHLPFNISSLSLTLTQIKRWKVHWTIKQLHHLEMETLFGLSWDFLWIFKTFCWSFPLDLAKYAGGISLVGFFFRFAAWPSSDLCTKHTNKSNKQTDRQIKEQTVMVFSPYSSDLCTDLAHIVVLYCLIASDTSRFHCCVSFIFVL